MRLATTTTVIGRLYFCANSKSRWSWPGTPITAPVPYSINTKFATQIGTALPVNGLIARAPGVEPFLLDFARHARVAILRLKARRLRRNSAGTGLAAPLAAPAVLGRQHHEVGAVDRVDPRREHFDIAVADRVAVRRPSRFRLAWLRRMRTANREPESASANRTRAPSDRPIQFRCIVRTFSGHSVSAFVAVEQFVGVVRDSEEPLLQLASRRPSCRSASTRRR